MSYCQSLVTVINLSNCTIVTKHLEIVMLN